MNFWRNKITVISIIIMTTLCLVSMGIAIRITLVMIEKQDQMIEAIPEDLSAGGNKSAKVPDAGKLQEQTFYFNGEQYEDLKAFAGDAGDNLVPIDSILTRIGIKFRWFSSDDLVEFSVNDKKVLIKLGESSFILGKDKIEMNWASFAAKNHILVPVEMFDYLDGFSVDINPERKTVFINHYADYAEEAGKIGFLRLVNGKVTISDITGTKVFWNRKSDSASVETLEPSPGRAGYLIKSDNKVYLAGEGKGVKPRLLAVPSSARWSVDGRFLHWIDWDKKTSFIFDIASSTVKKVGDYYFRVGRDGSNKDSIYAGDVLYDYKLGRGYKRVSLMNTENDGNYTFIERRGKTVIEGNAAYSPDRMKILYYKKDKGYYTAVVDGTRQVFLGDGVEARWINNNEIFLRKNGSEMFLVSYDGEQKVRVDSEWHKVGQAPDGSVFYVGRNMLYREINKSEKQIIQLPHGCDHVYPLTAEGPYIGVSQTNDSVFYISDKGIAQLGNYSLMFKSGAGEENNTNDTAGIAGSPDGKHAAALFREDGFVKIKITGEEPDGFKTLVLNYPVYDDQKTDDFSLQWISGDSLVVYTPQRGWVIDLGDGVQVHEWYEEGGVIKGLLLQ